MGSNCGSSCGDCDKRPKIDASAQPEVATKLHRNNKPSNFTAAVSDDSSSSDEESEYDTPEPSSTSTPKYRHSIEQPPPPSIIAGFKDAINRGKETLALDYIEQYPDSNLLSTPFDNEDNCLQVAIRNHHHRLVYCLLTQGISPNAQNPSTGDTALHTAVRARDTKMVTLLCKYMADPYTENENSETPISIANDNNDEDIMELLDPEIQDFIREKIVTIRGGNKGQLRPKPTNKRPSRDSLSPHLDRATTPVDTPYGILKRQSTKPMIHAFEKMADNHRGLPVLEAFLDKKSNKMGVGYQRRWVMVRKNYLLWSEDKRDIKDSDVKNVKERRKFNNSVNLLSIKEVKAVTESKTQRKFILIVEIDGIKKKKKEYLWRCASSKDRDYWVNGIKEHISQIKSMMAYLDQ